MQPIVNGLQEKYDEQVTFVSFNAMDGAEGEAIFRHLGLRGHPAILIYTTDEEEIFRQLGAVDEEILADTLDEILTQ